MPAKQATDVVVIGAGVIGCAVAFELARRGARVAVIDPRGIARGATFASAGVLAPYLEADRKGPLLPLAVKSLAMYDGFVATVSEVAGLSFPYRRSGTLEVTADEDGFKRLQGLAADLPAARGIILDREAAREAEPQLAEDVIGALLIEEHGFVAAADLTAALARGAAAKGATFLPPRSAVLIEADGAAVSIATTDGAMSAAAVVLAAGTWSGQLGASAQPPLPVRPVRGQLLRLRWHAPPLARVVWGPRCYLVPWPDGSLLVGATMEEVGFDERTTVAGVRDLLESVCDLAPGAWQSTFDEARVGLRPAAPDLLPIVGPSSRVPGLVYATAHHRNGVLLAPVTASLVADLVLEGRADPALEPLAPSRFGYF